MKCEYKVCQMCLSLTPVWKLQNISDTILLLLQMQIICGEGGEFGHMHIEQCIILWLVLDKIPGVKLYKLQFYIIDPFSDVLRLQKC
jgi:hypothetical protein